jgi:hypothetical protein
MTAMVLACVLLAQTAVASPPQATLAAYGAGAADPNTVAVRGEAELSPAAAFESARERAEQHVRERWEQRGQRLLDEQRPFWLPAPLAERAVQRWLATGAAQAGIQIVDREERTREHEFGSSWQTTLWVAEDPRVVANGERSLRRALRQQVERTLLAAGGTVVFWGLLAFALSWIDRLSRGYMTGRLAVTGLGLGVALPAIAFLL